MNLNRLFTVLVLALFVLILTPSSIAESNLKTDVKIITRLESGGFLTPALSENNTFVYDHFEFNLYANRNNTTYRILIDNITIASSIIRNFKEVFYWHCLESFISLIEIYIADDYYNYSNIFVFSSDITNRSILREKDRYRSFTKEELKQFIQEIELKTLGKVMVGGFACGFVCHYFVKKHKEETIKRIL